MYIGFSLRPADKNKYFSKGDTPTWSFKFCSNTKCIDDTIPLYPIENL